MKGKVKERKRGMADGFEVFVRVVYVDRTPFRWSYAPWWWQPPMVRQRLMVLLGGDADFAWERSSRCASARSTSGGGTSSSSKASCDVPKRGKERALTMTGVLAAAQQRVRSLRVARVVYRDNGTLMVHATVHAWLEAHKWWAAPNRITELGGRREDAA
jgi:hypothetical protein